jgi:hypothetical protein
MSGALKAGDRLRVTARVRVPGYQPGDKGTVMSGPHLLPSGARYYIARMDQDHADKRVIFADDEVEADA